jgi:hypothetical protein
MEYDVDAIVAEFDKAAEEGRLIPGSPEELALFRAAAWKGYKGESEPPANEAPREKVTA